ncbi:hypothetical protein Fmac_020645 [Flemingia macrophylla]|uniref:Uncharacterized protein n=1 Tax=Flemingia macrophylla TaxID=520843 RepID=A0ABD1LUQ0_9FABA
MEMHKICGELKDEIKQMVALIDVTSFHILLVKTKIVERHKGGRRASRSHGGVKKPKNEGFLKSVWKISESKWRLNFHETIAGMITSEFQTISNFSSPILSLIN